MVWHYYAAVPRCTTRKKARKDTKTFSYLQILTHYFLRIFHNAISALLLGYSIPSVVFVRSPCFLAVFFLCSPCVIPLIFPQSDYVSFACRFRVVYVSFTCRLRIRLERMLIFNSWSYDIYMRNLWKSRERPVKVPWETRERPVRDLWETRNGY